MDIKQTFRGFPFIEFEDSNNKICSLQKSSVVTEHFIWLGVEKDCASNKVLMDSRMLLNREQVKELLPHLQTFIETSEI